MSPIFTEKTMQTGRISDLRVRDVRMPRSNRRYGGKAPTGGQRDKHRGGGPVVDLTVCWHTQGGRVYQAARIAHIHGERGRE